MEERVFYRVVSGLHASINTHLCANYLLSDKNGLDLTDPKGKWGPNLAEFQKRFSPDTTNGEGPNWLRNLYFVYLVELRALVKAAPYLEREEYFTGMKHFLNKIMKCFRYLFDLTLFNIIFHVDKTNRI